MTLTFLTKKQSSLGGGAHSAGSQFDAYQTAEPEVFGIDLLNRIAPLSNPCRK